MTDNWEIYWPLVSQLNEENKAIVLLIIIALLKNQNS